MAEPKWQPIETHPRDGEPMLAQDRDGDVRRVYANPELCRRIYRYWKPIPTLNPARPEGSEDE